MNHPDDDISRALHDAVSDVEPHRGLADLRSRTEKVTPMDRRWFLPTLAVAAVMAAVVGGAFWLTDDDRSGGAATGPSTQPPPTAPSVTAGSDPTFAVRAVPAYFVGATAHGEKLYREFQQKQVCPDTTCLLKAAVVASLNGQPDDPDYRSLWPDGTTVGAVSFDSDLIVVDLASGVHDRPSGMSAADAELAVQQAIFSAQAAVGQGRLPVQLMIAGQHTDTVLGVPASEPLASANPDDVVAPVQIDAPAEGAEVEGTFTVTGRAAAFEANVVWELKQGDAVVKDGFATAQECCTLSPYEFEVTVPPGDYTLVVHDTDESGEGRPVNQDTKEITVR
jgi:hypothetical protein